MATPVWRWWLAIAGCTLVGCGGSSEEAAPLTVGFSDANSALTEGASGQIAIVLHSANGALEEELQVTVRASGSATPGDDHDFIADRVVTFAVGAEDGATQLLDVAAVADGIVEGADETLVLTLLTPSQGALVGNVHTIDVVESDFARLAFVPSSAIDEGDVGNVEVELNLDPGMTLGVDISAMVADAGTGTAAAGSDYLGIAQQSVTFPNGAADGTRRAIVVTSIEDGNVEADETIVFSLSSVSAGGQLGVSTINVVIADDEVAGDALLLVNGALDGGANNQVVDGQGFNLGSATVGSGSTQTLELLLQNAGGMPIDIEPLAVTGDVADFSIVLSPEPESLEVPLLGAFPLAIEHDDASFGATLALDPSQLVALNGSTAATLFDVELPGGMLVTLELERAELPLTPDAVIEVDGNPMPAAQVIGDLSMWSGRATGFAGSEAFLSFSSTASQGWLRLGNGYGNLHLITEHANGEPTAHWIWESQLEQNFDGNEIASCQGERSVPGQAWTADKLSTPDIGALTVGLALPECRLAIETDFQLFEKLGSASAVTQYVTELIAAVSAVYERDVQTRLTIVYLGVHTNSNDGWDAQDPLGADAGDVLDEFKAAWEGNIPNNADLAHFISGAPLGGGVAYVGALCDSFFGFGVSGSINGNINWGTFNAQPSVINWDFVVVAHELGHNFGSTHTHSYCPPVDHCNTNCDGPTGCELGTIMSYCHLCGGMGNIELEFHPTVAERMRQEVESSCLPTATLDPGGEISLTVTLEPHDSAGAKAAEIELQHTAPNEASPFSIGLTGTGTN